MKELAKQEADALANEAALPPGWAIGSVWEILEVNYGKGLTKNQRDETGTVPVYGSAGITGYHTEALCRIRIRNSRRAAGSD